MAKGSHGGAAGSWLAVVIMWIGFAVGGIALVPHAKWWMFWIGVAIVAVGGVIGLLVGITGDVVVDGPRVLPEKTRYHGDKTELRGAEFGETTDHATATDAATTRHHG